MGTMTFCSTIAKDFRDSRGSSWEEGKVPKKISRPIAKIMDFRRDFISDSSLKIVPFLSLHGK
jgi:hypothetical protein